MTEDIVDSRRLVGAAAIQKRDKGPARQAPAMELEHVQRLHEALESGSNQVDRLGAGVIIVCLYARARWSDPRCTHHVEDECKHSGSLVLHTREQTSSVGERREKFLPLIVPWHGVTHEDWLSIFRICTSNVAWTFTRFVHFYQRPRWVVGSVLVH